MRQQTQEGLVGQTGRRPELSGPPGVGTQGWSGLHLDPTKKKTLQNSVNPPENIGGMVGGIKPRLGGGAISA